MTPEDREFIEQEAIKIAGHHMLPMIGRIKGPNNTIPIKNIEIIFI